MKIAHFSLGSAVAATALGGVVWYAANLSHPSVAQINAASAERTWIEYTADGKAKQPVGYRKWMYLGTPLTPNDMNDGEANFPEFHNVYMDPDSFAHFEKTGQYRDGTVIVKELTSVGTKKSSSGNGYFQGEFIGLEISVRDSKRYPKDPGNWAFFSFGHKPPLKQEAAKSSVASCNQCHDLNATNFVFSAHYPVLRAAAPKK